MKTFDQVLAEYKKFGVTYTPEENKIKVPATSAFEGMCGADLKERVRNELIENEIDCSQLIWLIDGDHDWKSYFAQVDAERKTDYLHEDLRIHKNSEKEKSSDDVEEGFSNIKELFPNGGGMVGAIPINAQPKVEEIIKKYGCTPKYQNGSVYGYDVTGTPEQVAQMFKELSQIPGVSNMGFATDKQIEQLTDYFNDDQQSPSDKFKSLVATLPPHLKQKYGKMEKTINELSFYGVHLDNMRDLTEIAKIAGDDQYFSAMLKESDTAVLISIPEDSILLYEDQKAAGMEFAKLIGKRIREDLFFGLDVKVRGKVRKGETWGIQEVAASGYILSKFYEMFPDTDCSEDYKSVD